MSSPVQMISRRVEDNGSGPDRLQLLHHYRMGKEPLRLGPNGDLEAGDATRSGQSLSSKTRSPCRGRVLTLEGVELVRQGIDQFPSCVFSQQLNRKQLADHCPSLTRTAVSGIEMNFFFKLQAVGHQSIECGSRKVGGHELLLDRLDKELRHLWGTQLVPGQRGFTSGGN